MSVDDRGLATPVTCLALPLWLALSSTSSPAAIASCHSSTLERVLCSITARLLPDAVLREHLREHLLELQAQGFVEASDGGGLRMERWRIEGLIADDDDGNEWVASVDQQGLSSDGNATLSELLDELTCANAAPLDCSLACAVPLFFRPACIVAALASRLTALAAPAPCPSGVNDVDEDGFSDCVVDDVRWTRRDVGALKCLFLLEGWLPLLSLRPEPIGLPSDPCAPQCQVLSAVFRLCGALSGRVAAWARCVEARARELAEQAKEWREPVDGRWSSGASVRSVGSSSFDAWSMDPDVLRESNPGDDNNGGGGYGSDDDGDGRSDGSVERLGDGATKGASNDVCDRVLGGALVSEVLDGVETVLRAKLESGKISQAEFAHVVGIHRAMEHEQGKAEVDDSEAPVHAHFYPSKDTDATQSLSEARFSAGTSASAQTSEHSGDTQRAEWRRTASEPHGTHGTPHGTSSSWPRGFKAGSRAGPRGSGEGGPCSPRSRQLPQSPRSPSLTASVTSSLDSLSHTRKAPDRAPRRVAVPMYWDWFAPLWRHDPFALAASLRHIEQTRFLARLSLRHLAHPTTPTPNPDSATDRAATDRADRADRVWAWEGPLMSPKPRSFLRDPLDQGGWDGCSPRSPRDPHTPPHCDSQRWALDAASGTGSSDLVRVETWAEAPVDGLLAAWARWSNQVVAWAVRELAMAVAEDRDSCGDLAHELSSNSRSDARSEKRGDASSFPHSKSRDSGGLGGLSGDSFGSGVGSECSDGLCDVSDCGVYPSQGGVGRSLVAVGGLLVSTARHCASAPLYHFNGASQLLAALEDPTWATPTATPERRGRKRRAPSSAALLRGALDKAGAAQSFAELKGLLGPADNHASYRAALAAAQAPGSGCGSGGGSGCGSSGWLDAEGPFGALLASHTSHASHASHGAFAESRAGSVPVLHLHLRDLFPLILAARRPPSTTAASSSAAEAVRQWAASSSHLTAAATQARALGTLSSGQPISGPPDPTGATDPSGSVSAGSSLTVIPSQEMLVPWLTARIDPRIDPRPVPRSARSARSAPRSPASSPLGSPLGSPLASPLASELRRPKAVLESAYEAAQLGGGLPRGCTHASAGASAGAIEGASAGASAGGRQCERTGAAAVRDRGKVVSAVHGATNRKQPRSLGRDP